MLSKRFYIEPDQPSGACRALYVSLTSDEWEAIEKMAESKGSFADTEVSMIVGNFLLANSSAPTVRS
jgi:hypothetical protein